MVKVVTDFTVRGLRQKERLERLRQLQPPGVRVVPTSDDYRRVIKHPRAGAFRKEGSMEWPNDRFTKKRIAEGSIKLESGDEHERRHDRRQSRSDTDSAA
jgi:hypothetical protein